MSIGRLIRHLDLDLIARIEAGTVFQPKPMKRMKPPRKAESYRGARRNDAIHGDDVHGVWHGVTPTGALYRPPVRANRNRNWVPFRGRLYAAGSR